MILNKGIDRNVAATAKARKIACFVWGMAIAKLINTGCRGRVLEHP